MFPFLALQPIALLGEIVIATWVVVTLILLIIAASVAMYLMMPSANQQPGPDKNSLEDFTIPTADEDRVVPEVFGTRLFAPNIIWYGNLDSKKIKKKVGSGKNAQEVTVGYRYKLSLLCAIGGVIDELREFRRSNEVAWSGSITSNGSTFSARTGRKAAVNGSGTGKSTIKAYLGTQTSIDSDYEDQSGDSIPYRETSLLWMDQVFVGDNTTSIEPFQVLVTRRPSMISGTGDHLVGTYDYNPADAIWRILEDHLDIPTSLIDTASFTAAQEALHDEGTGISFVMSQAKSANDWVQEILRHIDGFLFYSHEIGKWKLTLAREDYDVDDLDVVDDSKVKDLRIARQGWEDCFTDIKVSFISTRTWDFTNFNIVNPANRYMLGGQKTKSLSFPMFTDADTASKTATRVMARIFYPLATGSFRVSREYIDPEPGAVLLLNSEALGIAGMVIRVLGVAGVDSSDQQIEVEWAEDLFSIGTAEVVTFPPSSGGDDPDWSLEDEATVVVILDATQELALETAIAVLVAPPPTGTATGYDLIYQEDVLDTGEFYPYGVTTSSYSASTDILDEGATGFTFNSAVGVTAFNQTRDSWQRMAQVGVLVNAAGTVVEVVSVKTITDLGGGSWRATGIIRGLAGTDPATFGIGSHFFIVEAGDFQVVNVSGLALNASLSFTVEPFNPLTTGPTSSASHTYGYRPETPYPPGNLVATRVVNDITLDWVACNRHSQCGNVNADTIAPFEDDPEATFEVSAAGMTTVVVAVPQFTRNTASVVTYTVKALLRGRYSAGVDITI